jgi:hypothetical protein
MARGSERTFLVEVYVPKLDEPAAVAITLRCRAAVGQLAEQGVALRWLHSFALIDEETYLCLVAARDRDQVAQLSRRAGLEHDHVVEVVAIDGTQSTACLRNI